MIKGEAGVAGIGDEFRSIDGGTDCCCRLKRDCLSTRLLFVQTTELSSESVRARFRSGLLVRSDCGR